MKKLKVSLILAFAAMLCLPAYSQEVKELYKRDEAPTTYDNKKNFLGKNAELYVGQTLIVKYLPPVKQANGYSGFVLNPKKSGNKNIYKCNII